VNGEQRTGRAAAYNYDLRAFPQHRPGR